MSKWYEKYGKISSSLFTYENSGRSNGLIFPDRYKIDDGVETNWSIVGYTLNPPFFSLYESVAIMFENTKTFDKVWWHHNVNDNEDIIVTKIEIPNGRH